MNEIQLNTYKNKIKEQILDEMSPPPLKFCNIAGKNCEIERTSYYYKCDKKELNSL